MVDSGGVPIVPDSMSSNCVILNFECRGGGEIGEVRGNSESSCSVMVIVVWRGRGGNSMQGGGGRGVSGCTYGGSSERAGQR